LVPVPPDTGGQALWQSASVVHAPQVWPPLPLPLPLPELLAPLSSSPPLLEPPELVPELLPSPLLEPEPPPLPLPLLSWVPVPLSVAKSNPPSDESPWPQAEKRRTAQRPAPNDTADATFMRTSSFLLRYC
jgi:hypothetical protein